MPLYDITHPLAWVGPDKKDRLLIDDVTPRGLHRKVVARKGEMMNTVDWLNAAMSDAKGAEVRHWLIEKDGYWFLWMIWK